MSSPAQVFIVQETSKIRLEVMPKTAELELQQVILWLYCKLIDKASTLSVHMKKTVS